MIRLIREHFCARRNRMLLTSRGFRHKPERYQVKAGATFNCQGQVSRIGG